LQSTNNVNKHQFPAFWRAPKSAAPIIFAAVAMRAARMRKDELANPLR